MMATMPMTTRMTTTMIIPEYIDEAVSGSGARHSLRPEDAVGLYNMRLVSPHIRRHFVA